MSLSEITVGLNAVIVSVTDETPQVLTLETDAAAALPYGPLDPRRHRTLELGLRDWVAEKTGLDLGYVEQLYTFGDRDRDESGVGRQLSIVYVALTRGQGTSLSSAMWRPIYEFLPWEDWREGSSLATSARLALGSKAERGWTAELEERFKVAFGLEAAPWDTDRCLRRYELLFETGLVEEAGASTALGECMALDHRRMLATALGRVRGKIRYRPVVFELLPKNFTLLELQRVVEALAGKRLHKQNFRRLVFQGGLVEGTGELERNTGGRPAELFAFRREVLRERPSPGVGLPALPS